MAGAIPARPGEELIIDSLAACARHAFDGDQVERVAEVNIESARLLAGSMSRAALLARYAGWTDITRNVCNSPRSSAIETYSPGTNLCAPKR